MTATVLVAGIGNIFQSDDGFGVEVANRLAAQDFPSDVRVCLLYTSDRPRGGVLSRARRRDRVGATDGHLGRRLRDK